MSGGKRNTDIKNKLLDMVGEGESGMIWENSIETYTLPCVKEIANVSLLYDAGNTKLVFCDHREGWEGQGDGRGIKEGGNICISTAVSCWCMQKPSQYFKIIILQLKFFKRWVLTEFTVHIWENICLWLPTFQVEPKPKEGSDFLCVVHCTISSNKK